MEKLVKLQLRLPKGLHAWLVRDAARNDRSLNGQMVAILRERMAQEQRKKVGRDN